MNNDIIQILSVILSVIALILIVVVFAVNIYFKIRRCFPITVNCWFCNTWSKVSYENRNSFDCPFCLQYNGFTQDGSYNKIIDAQHNVNLNKTPSLKRSEKSSNGLCDSCNHNQYLKITQLAKFTPLRDDNYDVEIEHFRNQLEKTYQLCRHCTKVLNFTLLKEKSSFLGNHVFNIQKKGLNLYLNKPNIIIQKTHILVKIIKNIQGFIAFFVIFSVISQIISNDQSISKFLPTSFLPYLELFQDLSVMSSEITYASFNTFRNNLLFNFECSCLEFLSSLGLILQMFSFFMESSILTVKVNQLLCWSFLTLTSWTTIQETVTFTHLFQIFCSSMVFYNSFYEFDSSPQCNTSFKKLSKSTNEEFDEYSDNELETSSQSAKSYRSSVNDFVGLQNSSFNSTNKVTNDFPYNETENVNFTANKIFNASLNTARNLNNTTLYSNIRTSLEDLHLGDSIFKLGQTSPLPFHNRPVSPLSDRSKLILSPSKLKTVTQNSWVAGGFWRNENGTIVPVNEEAHLSRSSSQSSGFGSQINDNVNCFKNPFSSLPTSRKTSLCGEIDRFSLASEPPYHFQPVSPQPTWTNPLSCRSPNNFLNPQFNNTFGNIHKTSNQSFNEFVLPTANRIQNPLPLYNTSKPLGLFKLPQVSPSNIVNDSSIFFGNREIHPTNPFCCNINRESRETL